MSTKKITKPTTKYMTAGVVEYTDVRFYKTKNGTYYLNGKDIRSSLGLLTHGFAWARASKRQKTYVQDGGIVYRVFPVKEMLVELSARANESVEAEFLFDVISDWFLKETVKKQDKPERVETAHEETTREPETVEEHDTMEVEVEGKILFYNPPQLDSAEQAEDKVVPTVEVPVDLFANMLITALIADEGEAKPTLRERIRAWFTGSEK